MDPLLQKAAQGDQQAQAELVRSSSAQLQRYLDRRMGSHLRRTISVADLSQDVYARVFRAFGSLPDSATIRTFRRWLYRNADWVLSQHGGKARRHAGESVLGSERFDPVQPERDTTTGDVTRTDQLAWLDTLLGHLDPKYGDVVRLRTEGLSFQDIGRQLRIETATARQRFARVMRILREQHRTH